MPRPFCGASSADSLASLDPDTSSSRTSRTSLGWRHDRDSPEAHCGAPFSQKWPRSGSMSVGTFSPQPQLGLPIFGNEYSPSGSVVMVHETEPSAPRAMVSGSTPLLATPTAWLGRRNSHAQGDPARWTNPDRSNELSDQLAHIAMIPTPTDPASESGQGTRPGWQALGELRPVVESLSTGETTPQLSDDGSESTEKPRLRLSAEFCAWMMGTPSCSVCGLDWTDPTCGHSASAFQP